MIRLLHRKKRRGVNSIETVFNAIESKLRRHQNLTLPYEGASPVILLKNIYYALKHSKGINHVTGDAHYAVLGTGRRTLLTIHDVGSAVTGNCLKTLYVKLFWFWIPTLIAKKISVISDATKNDVIRLCPWIKNKIYVIPNPYNIEFEGEANTLTSDCPPRILHIGTKPNKNLERVITALQGLNCKLIIIGILSPIQKKLLKETKLDYENYFDIPTSKLIEEYRKCNIVSFPSYFEGFGMPIIEAQAASRPIIAGDIPVLHDIAGEKGAIFVNPYDVCAIRDGFLALMNHPELCSELIKNGKKNIQRFHPDKIAELYNSLYKLL